MDDLDDLQASQFVTDTEDQDSLDERIDSEQRLRNHQLWASFQNAASCLTKLYKDRAQPNISPWVPFQNAASNLTTLYKDCIESQRRFARIGYQVGRRRRMRELQKLLKKHKIPAKHLQALTANSDIGETTYSTNSNSIASTTISTNTTTATTILPSSDSNIVSFEDQLIPSSANTSNNNMGQQHNNLASILAVNKLNLGCDDAPSSDHMQAQPSYNQNSAMAQQQQSSLQIILGNNEDDLSTFQQALAQPTTVRGIKSSQNRRPCSNSAGYINNSRAIDPKSEEERLLELNEFLSEEYHRHVGSRKRSCPTLGGSAIKRLRD